MPKKGKAPKAPAVEVVAVEPIPDPTAGVKEAPTAPQDKTCNAPSGKHYVIAQENYPCELPDELIGEVVTASDGDLLELLLMQDGWAYGQRFRSRIGAVNEGVFRLEWVLGVKTVTQKDGQRCPVEVDIGSAEYGFQPPKANDTAARLRAKRHRKKLEDASKIWTALAGSTNSFVKQQAEAAKKAAAAKAAAALEREEACEKTRRQKRHRQSRRPATSEAPTEEAAKEEEDEVERMEMEKIQEQDTSTVSVNSCALQSNSQEQKQLAWDAQWEQQAALLEQQISSSSGMEDSEDRTCHRRSLQKKMMTRKFAKTLLTAKRSGELEAIAEEWERAHTEIASKASDLQALNDQVKQSMLSAKRAGDLECIADNMVIQVEKQAAEMKILKERVFRAMIDMKRSRDLEKSAENTASAQKELEMGACQLKNLMKRAWRGLLESKKSRELERIADEMAEQLHTKADPIKSKIRKALLRAHRAGHLLELRDELDELADSVPTHITPLNNTSPAKRWTECASSDSDSSFDPKEMIRQRAGGNAIIEAWGKVRLTDERPSGYPNEADISGSESSGEKSLTGSPNKQQQ